MNVRELSKLRGQIHPSSPTDAQLITKGSPSTERRDPTSSSTTTLTPACQTTAPVLIDAEDSSTETGGTGYEKAEKKEKSEKERKARLKSIKKKHERPPKLNIISVDEDYIIECSFETHKGERVQFKFSVDNDNPDDIVENLLTKDLIPKQYTELFIEQLQKTCIEAKTSGPMTATPIITSAETGPVERPPSSSSPKVVDPMIAAVALATASATVAVTSSSSVEVAAVDYVLSDDSISPPQVTGSKLPESSTNASPVDSQGHPLSPRKEQPDRSKVADANRNLVPAPSPPVTTNEVPLSSVQSQVPGLEKEASMNNEAPIAASSSGNPPRTYAEAAGRVPEQPNQQHASLQTSQSQPLFHMQQQVLQAPRGIVSPATMGDVQQQTHPVSLANPAAAVSQGSILAPQPMYPIQINQAYPIQFEGGQTMLVYGPGPVQIPMAQGQGFQAQMQANMQAQVQMQANIQAQMQAQIPATTVQQQSQQMQQQNEYSSAPVGQVPVQGGTAPQLLRQTSQNQQLAQQQAQQQQPFQQQPLQQPLQQQPLQQQPLQQQPLQQQPLQQQPLQQQPLQQQPLQQQPLQQQPLQQQPLQQQPLQQQPLQQQPLQQQPLQPQPLQPQPLQPQPLQPQPLQPQPLQPQPLQPQPLQEQQQPPQQQPPQQQPPQQQLPQQQQQPPPLQQQPLPLQQQPLPLQQQPLQQQQFQQKQPSQQQQQQPGIATPLGKQQGSAASLADLDAKLTQLHKRPQQKSAFTPAQNQQSQAATPVHSQPSAPAAVQTNSVGQQQGVLQSQQQVAYQNTSLQAHVPAQQFEPHQEQHTLVTHSHSAPILVPGVGTNAPQHTLQHVHSSSQVLPPSSTPEAPIFTEVAGQDATKSSGQAITTTRTSSISSFPEAVPVHSNTGGKSLEFSEESSKAAEVVKTEPVKTISRFQVQHVAEDPLKETRPKMDTEMATQPVQTSDVDASTNVNNREFRAKSVPDVSVAEKSALSRKSSIEVDATVSFTGEPVVKGRFTVTPSAGVGPCIKETTSKIETAPVAVPSSNAGPVKTGNQVSMAPTEGTEKKVESVKGRFQVTTIKEKVAAKVEQSGAADKEIPAAAPPTTVESQSKPAQVATSSPQMVSDQTPTQAKPPDAISASTASTTNAPSHSALERKVSDDRGTPDSIASDIGTSQPANAAPEHTKGYPPMVTPPANTMQPEGYYNQVPPQAYFAYPPEGLSPGMQGQMFGPMGFNFGENEDRPELKEMLQRHKDEHAQLLLRQQEELKQFQRLRSTPFVIPPTYMYQPFYPLQGNLLPQGYPMQPAFAMQQDPSMYNTSGAWTQGMVPLMGGQVQGTAGVVSTSSPPTLTSVSSVGHLMGTTPMYYGKRGSITAYSIPGFSRVDMGSAGGPQTVVSTVAQLPPAPTRLNKSESFAGLNSSGLPECSVAGSVRQRATTFPTLANADVNNTGSLGVQQVSSDPGSSASIEATFQAPQQMFFIEDPECKRVFSPTPSESSLCDTQEQVLTPEGEEPPTKLAEYRAEAGRSQDLKEAMSTTLGESSSKKRVFTEDQFKLAEIGKAPPRTTVTEAEKKMSLNELRKNQVRQDLQSNVGSGGSGGKTSGQHE